jgi:hypothetical protein
MVHATPGWHPTTEQNFIKFQRIPNRASRFIYDTEYIHKTDNRILSVGTYLKYIDPVCFKLTLYIFINANIT